MSVYTDAFDFLFNTYDLYHLQLQTSCYRAQSCVPTLQMVHLQLWEDMVKQELHAGDRLSLHTCSKIFIIDHGVIHITWLPASTHKATFTYDCQDLTMSASTPYCSTYKLETLRWFTTEPVPSMSCCEYVGGRSL